MTRGKYIYLRNYPYQDTEPILTGYRELKNRLLARYKYVTIFFLECPYYSVPTFNKALREGKNKDKYKTDQNNKTKTTKTSLVVKNYSGTRTRNSIKKGRKQEALSSTCHR